MMREHWWTVVLSPLLAGVPLFTLGNLLHETYFAHRWGRKLATRVAPSGASGQEAFLRCGSSSASS